MVWDVRAKYREAVAVHYATSRRASLGPCTSALQDIPRCCVDGPDEFDFLFESIVDEQFGYDPNSEYKRWVRRLYRLGLIPRIPREWELSEEQAGRNKFGFKPAST